jgi:tRNA nucleotidyltransferase (CCA-adding enzyme)
VIYDIITTMDNQKLYDLLYADPAALQAYEALSTAGGRVFIVGGAVRDALLGKQPKDIDLLVAGLDREHIEDALDNLPGNTTFAGKNFGIYHYRVKNQTVEIAMPRKERSTGEGHKDFDVNVDHTLPIEEDLQRRDFTANAMAFDIDSGSVIDPYGGQEDISKGYLRLVNQQAFKDDPLRIVRAIVAYSVHGLEPDDYTLDQMEVHASGIRNLAPERIQMELDKLLAGADPAEAFRIAWETGVLDYICPELSQAMGVNQHNIHHDLDVGEHSLAVLEYMTDLTDDPDLRLAALLHDLGKPDSMWMDDEGNGHFYADPDHPESANHEEVGADIAYNFMKRLHYPNNRINRVTTLVLHHMFPYFNSENGARKFINKLNGDTDMAQDLLTLRDADSHGKSSGEARPYDNEMLAKNRTLINDVIDKDQAFTVRDLAMNGNDLMQLGVTPGPEMGHILQELVDLVIDRPEMNTKDALIEYVKEAIL